MKTYLYLLCALQICFSVGHIKAQAPDGHPGWSLKVHNGSGSGRYQQGDQVSVSASIPEGFYFIKWVKDEGSGLIGHRYQQNTSFTMPGEAIHLTAILAKIESWFPIIENDESIDTWLLLQRPTGGSSAVRFPHRVRVTVDTSDGIDLEQAFKNIQVRLGWFPTPEVEDVWHSEELVKYWNQETGGVQISRESFLPKELFEDKGKGLFEATVWFAGDWTPKNPEDIPEGQHYVPPEALAGFDLVAHGPNFDQTVMTSSNKLLKVDLKVSSDNSPTGSDPKYIDSPMQGSADNLFAVWDGEDFTVNIVTPIQTFPAGFIKWNVPGFNIPDNTLEFTFSFPTVGTKRIEIIFGSDTKKIWVDVPYVGTVTRDDAALSVGAVDAATIFEAAVIAQNHANAAHPVGPRRDAIRHAMWNSVAVSSGILFAPPEADVLLVTTAHEFDNKNTDMQQAFNSSMDLFNNIIGAGVVEPMIGGANLNAIVQDLEGKYDSGELRKWDGNGAQEDSEGILFNSDDTKVIPAN